MISVVIATFNREHTIIRAIDSILKQDYKDYEIVIVDDGSTDNTKEIIKNLRNNKIKYFYIPNSGAGNAKNFGVSKSTYPYILFVDSDDELYLDNNIFKYIEKEIKKVATVISFKRILKLFSNKQFIGAIGNIKNMKDYILKYPLNYPGKPPYIIKKSLYIKAGGLNTNVKWGEAILYWRKLFLLNPQFSMIDKVAYIYHLEGNDNISKAKLSSRKRIDLVYESICHSYLELYDKLDIKYKTYWEIVLLGISILRKYKIKDYLVKILHRNYFTVTKAICYVIYKRLFD